MVESQSQAARQVRFLELEIKNISGDLGRVKHHASNRAIVEMLERRKEVLRFYQDKLEAEEKQQSDHKAQ